MKLLNPTDADLNAAFARKVMGRKLSPEHEGFMSGPDERMGGQVFESWHAIPRFTTSADAVLPWLEKREDVEIHRVQSDGWQVSIMEVKRTPASEETGVIAEAWEDTLPKAATIALLRAHGVEVEFTDAPKTP